MTKSQNDQQAVKSNASTFVCVSPYPQSRQLCVRFYDGWCSYVKGLWLIFVKSAKSNKLTSREGNFPDIKTDWKQLLSRWEKFVCLPPIGQKLFARLRYQTFSITRSLCFNFNPPCSKNFCLLNCNYDKLCTSTVFNCSSLVIYRSGEQLINVEEKKVFNREIFN